MIMIMIMITMLMITTVMRRTDHVARHVTAESTALPPVEPIRVFLTDDLDQLEGDHNHDHEDHQHEDEIDDLDVDNVQ